MTIFYLNALSSNGQIEPDQVDRFLERLLECMALLRPGFAAGTLVLVVDECISARPLTRGSVSFLECLGKVQNRGLVTRWFLATRNHRRLATPALDPVALVAKTERISGDVSPDVLTAPILVGFGGSPGLDATAGTIMRGDGSRKREVSIVSRKSEIWKFVPKYEESPKHVLEEYVRQGMTVSAMTVLPSRAQEVLTAAIGSERERFGRDGDRYVRFLLTGYVAEAAVFHGFEVARTQVPQDVAARLDQQ